MIEELTDAQWLMLDLLMRARKRGVHSINRMELLNTPTLPQQAKVQLTFGALLMVSTGAVEMAGQHDFIITEKGIQLYNLRFGTAQAPAEPTRVADAVIYLPGPESVRN